MHALLMFNHACMPMGTKGVATINIYIPECRCDHEAEGDHDSMHMCYALLFEI